MADNGSPVFADDVTAKKQQDDRVIVSAQIQIVQNSLDNDSKCKWTINQSKLQNF